MDAVDWTGLSVLAVLLVACVGALSPQMHRMEDRLRADLRSLSEAYIRHLEQHASH